MAKMRLLTFMGMAVEFKEISFDTMQQELQVGADDVEAFVIDGTSASPQINLSCLPLLSMLLATNGGEKRVVIEQWSLTDTHTPPDLPSCSKK